MLISNQLAQPSIVAAAVRLLYATLAIGLVRSLIESSRLAEASSVGFVLFNVFAVLGLLWLLIHLISRGRNWARITILVFFVLGVPMSILPLIQSLKHNPISGILGLVQIVMQVVALVFLFQGESSAWFKAIKQSKTEARHAPPE